MTGLVIFTDLDGTLLDHNDYSYHAAEPALATIKARGYPLILVSSKTRVELQAIQQQLGISAPFICENGAAVYWRSGTLTNALSTGRAGHAWQHHSFSPPRAEILLATHKLREQYHYQFSGFADYSLEQIAQLTGLEPAACVLAAKREYTEPIIWADTPARLQQFQLQLAALNLRAVQGGRFISVMGAFDKVDAMQWLQGHYQQQAPVLTVVLGDSPNDEAMLNAADIAVVIQSAHSNELTVDKPQQIIYSKQPGPVGWQQVMAQLLHEQVSLQT